MTTETLPMREKLTCSHLRELTGKAIPYLPRPEIIRRLLALYHYATLETQGWGGFQTILRNVTNAMIKETAFYKALSEDEKRQDELAAFDAMLEDRCMACSRNIWSDFHSGAIPNPAFA